MTIREAPGWAKRPSTEVKAELNKSCLDCKWAKWSNPGTGGDRFGMCNYYFPKHLTPKSVEPDYHLTISLWFDSPYENCKTWEPMK